MNRAEQIVEQLLALPTVGALLESPRYYPGQFAYQADTKFQPLSKDNYNAKKIIGQNNEFTFALTPSGDFGYVFSVLDIENPPKLGLVPVMTVQLRPSSIKGYKQAFRLRIRENFARRGVATLWYVSYVKHAGGVVSDFEHLEGGRRLWKSFVRTAVDSGLTISLVNSVTNEWTTVTAQTPDSAIWSEDNALQHLALVLEKDKNGTTDV